MLAMALYFRDFSMIQFARSLGPTLVRRQRVRMEGFTATDTGQEIVLEPNTGGPVDVRSYGAVGDGVTDDGPAFRAAIATGRLVYVPPVATYYKIVGTLTINAGGLVGDECHQADGGVWSRLMFFGCADSTVGVINTRQATSLGGAVRLSNLYVQARSWTESLGYGLDLETVAIVSNCFVTGFKRSGVWMHHNAGSVTGGPYQSRLENVTSQFNGNHGVFVGNGANNVTIVNYQGLWNGAPSYLTKPTALNKGSGCGFIVAQSADGGTYSAYTPEGLVIIGGDCSYNADWGWNFHEVANSNISPGYCEGNLAAGGKQVRWQYPIKTHIQLTHVEGNESGLEDASSYQPYEWGSKVMLGGKQVYPSTFYDKVLNPTTSDVDGATIENAPQRVEYLSRRDDGLESVYTTQNTDGPGANLNAALETALNVRLTSSAHWTVGGTTRYLRVSNNKVQLPDLFYWATGTGWGAAEVACQRHIARGSVGPGQSVPDAGAVSTLVTLTEDFDVGVNFAASLFTAPITGYYAVSAHAALTTTAGWFQVSLRNGANDAGYSEGGRCPGNLAGQARSELSDIVALTAGQTLGLYCYQDSGGAKDLITARLAVHYLWS